MDSSDYIQADDVEEEILDDDDRPAGPGSEDVSDMMDDVDLEDYDADAEIDEESDQELTTATTYSAHKGAVFAIDVNSKIGVVVSGSQDDMAHVWNIDNGETIFTCDGHKDSVTCVCFSPDGKLVATGDMSGIIQVWNVESHQKVWSFETGDLEWLEWHPVATVLLAGTQDGQCWMWQVPKDNCKIFESQGVATNCGKFLPDGKCSIVCYEDGTCKLIDLKTSDTRFSIKGREAHEGSISEVACSADGSLIATASLDGTVKLISTSTGKITKTYECKNQNAANQEHGDGEFVECVTFSPMLPLLASGCSNGLLHIWDHKSGILRHSCKHDQGITKLLWDHQRGGYVVYTACLDGVCRSWDARNGQLLHSYQGPAEHIYDMKLSSSGEKLVAAYADGIVRVFQTDLGSTGPFR